MAGTEKYYHCEHAGTDCECMSVDLAEVGRAAIERFVARVIARYQGDEQSWFIDAFDAELAALRSPEGGQ